MSPCQETMMVSSLVRYFEHNMYSVFKIRNSTCKKIDLVDGNYWYPSQCVVIIKHFVCLDSKPRLFLTFTKLIPKIQVHQAWASIPAFLWNLKALFISMRFQFFFANAFCTLLRLGLLNFHVFLVNTSSSTMRFSAKIHVP